jgi:uncharacterized membrane protein
VRVIGEREAVDAPSRSDRFVAGLAEAIGGPLGTHAASRRLFWTAGRILLALTCLTMALHWVQKSPCRQSENWANLGQLSRFCYSDVMALYGAEGGLSQGGLPYLDYPLEYPVLTGIFMALIGVPVHALGQRFGVNEFVWFYDLTALGLAAFAVATTAMLVALRRRRPWDVAMFALAPALLLSATVNWDLLAIVLAVGGLLAWARRHPVLAGILLGLGAAAKLWPGFLFLPLIVLGIRAGRTNPVWTAVASGAAAWLAVNLPVMLANPNNWLQFLRLNRDRAIDWGTFWYVGRYLDERMDPVAGPFQWLSGHVNPQLNWLTYGLFGLACVGICALAWLAPREPRVAALAFLVVAAFLLTSKVWSQQFVLWLLPLALLARPRWGAFLAWQAAEVGYFFAFYGQLIRASGNRPEQMFLMPEGWFILAAGARWVTVAALCGFVIYDVLHPREDVVRRTYPEGDPDAGLLAQVEDDHAGDVLPGDAGLVAGGGEGRLPRGAGHPVGQDHHRGDAE